MKNRPLLSEYLYPPWDLWIYFSSIVYSQEITLDLSTRHLLICLRHISTCHQDFWTFSVHCISFVQWISSFQLSGQCKTNIASDLFIVSPNRSITSCLLSRLTGKSDSALQLFHFFEKTFLWNSKRSTESVVLSKFTGPRLSACLDPPYNLGIMSPELYILRRLL